MFFHRDFTFEYEIKMFEWKASQEIKPTILY